MRCASLSLDQTAWFWSAITSSLGFSFFWRKYARFCRRRQKRVHSLAYGKQVGKQKARPGRRDRLRDLIRPVQRHQPTLAIRELNFEEMGVVFVPVLLLDDGKGLSTQRMGGMCETQGGRRRFYWCIDFVA